MGVIMKNLALGLAIALLWSTAAQAHEWYPPECCSDKDCSQIDRERVRADGLDYVVDGVHRKLRSSTPSSPDSHYHACFNALTGNMVCFFAPGVGA